MLSNMLYQTLLHMKIYPTFYVHYHDSSIQVYQKNIYKHEIDYFLLLLKKKKLSKTNEHGS